jgi:hypothetical protein
LLRLAAALSKDEKRRELHWRTGRIRHLPHYCPLILAQNLQAAAPVQLAVLEIHQDLDFPRLERIARHCSAHHFTDQSVKAIDHQLLFDEIFPRHESGLP